MPSAPPRSSQIPTAQDARARFPKLAGLIDYLASLQARADLGTLSRLLGGLEVTRSDVECACAFGTKSYRRNVLTASPWFELLALTWRSGHCTPIHDHTGVSCAFRVIHGVGTEVRYALTPSGMICPSGTTSMSPGYICAANDADIHQVANMQAPGADLITLHIYSPRIVKMQTYSVPTSEGCELGDVYGG